MPIKFLKLILPLLFLIHAHLAFSQGNHPKPKRLIFLGTGISDQLYSINRSYVVTGGNLNDEVNALKKNTLLGMSFCGGIILETPSLFHYGFQIDSYAFRAKWEYPDRITIGDTIVVQTNHRKGCFRDNYLSFPLGIGKNIGSRKEVQLSFKIGIKPQIFLASYERIISKFDSKTLKSLDLERPSEYKNITFSSYAMLTFLNSTTKKYALHGSLIGEINVFSTLEAKASYRSRWYSIGILMGVTI